MMEFIVSMIMAGVEATIKGLREEISNLCSELYELAIENLHLQFENKQLVNDNETLKKHNEDLRCDLDSYSEVLGDKDAHIRHQSDTIRDLQSNNTQLRISLDGALSKQTVRSDYHNNDAIVCFGLYQEALCRQVREVQIMGKSICLTDSVLVDPNGMRLSCELLTMMVAVKVLSMTKNDQHAIAVIKFVRATEQCELKEAKNLVDIFRRDLHKVHFHIEDAGICTNDVPAL